jgi:flagellar biosynthetic protein FliR
MLIPTVGTPIPLSTPVGDIILIEVLNFTFGFASGLVANILFWAVDFAGDIYGYQLGFSAATVYDPNTENESVILSQLASMSFLIIFVIIKGPMILFQTFVESFRTVPLTIITIHKELPLEFSTIMGNVLLFGLQIGLPMIAFMILVTFVLGIMSKLLPQLNVFIVGLPLKVLVGLIILIGLLPIWADIIIRYTRELTTWVNQILKWF